MSIFYDRWKSQAPFGGWKKKKPFKNCCSPFWTWELKRWFYNRFLTGSSVIIYAKKYYEPMIGDVMKKKKQSMKLGSLDILGTNYCFEFYVLFTNFANQSWIK